MGLLALAHGLAGPALAADTASATVRPVSLTQAAYGVKDGQEWVHWDRTPLVCAIGFGRAPRWPEGKPDFDPRRLSEIFHEEVQRAGLQSGASDNLFERDRPRGGLEIGAVIRDMQATACQGPFKGDPVYKGWVEMTVEWQVYDPTRREMLVRVQTTVRGEQKHYADRGISLAIIDGFRQSAVALLAKPEFLQAIRGADDNAEKSPKPADRSTLLVALAKDGKTPIPQAVGSVVTVFSADGQGSGFLISADGYLLTARHVVGDAKVVRVRWSDGFETEGEVLRADKHRDVALIKSSAHSRQPLALRAQLLNAGDTVYAIGAPLGEKQEGTVTRGIVSAYRLRDGLNYVQSDVMINHGNSGGPLLDERGAVVGIADEGLFPDGDRTPVGINFFVPIGDALDFLAIKPAP